MTTDLSRVKTVLVIALTVLAGVAAVAPTVSADTCNGWADTNCEMEANGNHCTAYHGILGGDCVVG